MFDDHYVNWQMSRIDTIEKYLGFEFFKNKSVSEIGCGYAFFGNYLSKFCDRVTVSDARIEHIETIKQNYPHLTTHVMDVDGEFMEEKTDVLIDFGVLYHIINVESHIKSFSNYDYIILETEVVDSDQNTTIIVNEEQNIYDQAYNGVGSRPSQLMVENFLSTAGYDFMLIKDSILNTPHHTYDWEIQNTNTWRNGLRRFWVCWKKELNNPCVIS